MSGRPAWSEAAAITGPPLPEPGRRILFQRVPEPKVAKNRWHLDLNVGRARIEEEAARLIELGARVTQRIDEPGAFHVTMQDPEGNEFCVQ